VPSDLKLTAAGILAHVLETSGIHVGTTIDRKDLENMAASLDGQLSALIAAAKATTSAEQRAVEAEERVKEPTRAELEQLAQSPDGRRQIDLLAAERVMGWKRFDYVFGKKAANKYTFYCDQLHRSDGVDIEPWSPTTSIADAWQLVGRLAKSNIRIRLIDDRDRIDKWSVRFYPSSTKIEYITHDDECIAITIAAILAGGEKEKA